MTRRVLCPFHKERTPSVVVYDDKYYCFGCGKHGPITELGFTIGDIRRVKPANIPQDMAYIDRLPTGLIRGLMLPHDETHYYVVWPERDYYKKRSKLQTSSKYLCPPGHRKPLFVAQTHMSSNLFIIEGELNALSAAAAKPPATIVSPGSCVEFTSKKYQEYYEKFSRIWVFADADRPGVEAAKELKNMLLSFTPHVTLALMEQDFNDILTTRGVEGVKAYLSNLQQR